MPSSQQMNLAFQALRFHLDEHEDGGVIES
jgi:hypothetical protein